MMLVGVKVVGMKMLFVLGGFMFFIEWLKVCFGFDYVYVNMFEIVDGKFIGKVFGEIVNVDVKVCLLCEMCVLFGFELYCVIVMGDGLNDLKMMVEVGLLVVFYVKFVVCDVVMVVFDYVGFDGLL